MKPVEDEVASTLQISGKLSKEPWCAADLYAPHVVGAFLPPDDAH